MLEINTAFEILPIKPGFNKKQINNAGKKTLARYKPDKVRDVNPEELKDILMDKYREIFKLANTTWMDVKKGNMQYNSQESYNSYKTFFKRNLDSLTKDDLIVILEANELPTDGNKNQLQNRIIDNVPSHIAVLNKDEHDLREQYKPRIEEVLKRFKDNKLVRILQLKNIQANGNSTTLINKIVSNISEDEIYNLIDQVDREIDDAKNKLNGLNDQQLKQILDNNDFNSRGNKTVLINKIIENVPIAEIEDNINRVRINKQKLLKKLYLITGKDELLESYKQKLATKHLDINQGIQIRNQIVSLINNYQIEENKIASKLDELINKKSQEIINDNINELYKITGKTQLNSKFLKKLKQAGLDKNDSAQIKNEIIADIKSWKVGKDNLSHYVNIKISQKKLIKQNEKLEILYGITGKTNIKLSFLKLLSDHGLDEQEGVQIKNELINLIKTTNIDKNKINPKLSELITLEAFKKLINNCDISYLDQIAMMNNLSRCNTKEIYIESFLNSISSSFNDLKLKSDISKIDNVKERLVKLYKNQLEFILISNNVSSTGTKDELINNIISNIPIRGINLILSEIEKTTEKLNQLTMNELSFILKENNIKVAGGKTQVINEINKAMPVNLIKNDIKKLDKIKSTLNELNLNELKFIAKSNNLIVKDNESQLIDEIGTQVPVTILSENITEINNLKTAVRSFNKLQRQHILKSNLLNDAGDDETQINEILENIDLFEIANFNNELNEIKYELDNLSVIQLNYILNNHNLEKSDNSSIQIETILENILIPFIKRDIQSIKELKNKIDGISEDEIDNILSKNKLRKSIHKNKNIKTIVENLSFDKINGYLSGINDATDSLEELENLTLICPIKIFKGKKTLTTEKRGNSIFLLLFNNEELFNEYKQNNKSVKKLENNLDYFKKLINKNRKIEGILIKTPEEIIIKKD